jgi:hypothetical protein
MQTANAEADVKSSLEGLWVLLIDQDANRIPMMARAGNHETYLLGFKNMFNARKFIAASDVANVEPRMVVKGNKAEFLRVAQTNGAVGVLVDYDPTTHDYASAAELY